MSDKPKSKPKKKPEPKKPAKKYKGSLGNGIGKVDPGKKVTY